MVGPGHAALHITMTGLVSDRENDSRSGNKIYKTPPPSVQAQPKGMMGGKTKQCPVGQEVVDQSPVLPCESIPLGYTQSAL